MVGCLHGEARYRSKYWVLCVFNRVNDMHNYPYLYGEDMKEFLYDEEEFE